MKRIMHAFLAQAMLLSCVGTSLAMEAQEETPQVPTAYTQTLSSRILSSDYAHIDSFSEGLAAVTTHDGKVGIIDGYGTEILAPSDRYHSIGSFNEGIAVFYTYDINDEGDDTNGWTPAEGEAGYLNIYGEEVYCEESEAGRGSIILGDFANGYGFIYNSWMTFSDSGSFTGAGEGNFLMDIYGNVNPIKYAGDEYQWRFFGQVDESGLLAFHNGEYDYNTDGFLWGFQRVDGSVVLQPQYHNFSASGFVNGLCAVQNSSGLWGYINTSGTLVIPYQFHSYWDFADGYVAFKDQNGFVGFMDSSGKVAIEPQFYGTYGFEEGFAWVTSENGAGLINKAGEMVVPYQFDSMSPIEHGYTTVGCGEWIDGTFTGTRGLMDTAGNMVVPMEYDNVRYTGDSNMVITERNGVFTLMELGNHEPLTPLSGASDWATPYIEYAYEAGLLDGLDHMWGDYTSYMTREEFCTMIINFYHIVGVYVPTENNPFVDTNNLSVVGAYHLGIVGGKSATEFYPKAHILRQELAVMLYRAVGMVEDIPTPNLVLTFHDNDLIMDWAMDAMTFAVAYGFLVGSDNYITPSDNLTREQAIVVARNLYQKFV